MYIDMSIFETTSVELGKSHSVRILHESN